MKTFLNILIVGIIAFLFAEAAYVNKFIYEKEVQSYWDLADKSSTIEEKSKYIDQFVAQFEKPEFQGKHSALIFKTPNNSFEYNFNALKSLQTRLNEIKTMDMTSFEYQTAIQQITQQEQGEASELVTQLKSIWIRTYYIEIWDWVFTSIMVLICITGMVVNGLFVFRMKRRFSRHS